MSSVRSTASADNRPRGAAYRRGAARGEQDGAPRESAAIAPQREQVADQYAEVEEYTHRRREQQQVEHVGRRRHHSGQDENREYREAALSQQESRRDYAERRQQEDQHRQFEDYRDAQHHIDERLEIDIQRHLRDDELAFRDTQQERQAVGKNHEVGEHTAEHEESRRTDDQWRRPAAFVAVESRSDEGPELVEHPGRADKDRPHDGQLDPDNLETIHRVEDIELRRIAERLQRVRGRAADEAPQRIGKGQADDERGSETEQRFDDPRASFGEVLDERHARASPRGRERA